MDETINLEYSPSVFKLGLQKYLKPIEKVRKQSERQFLINEFVREINTEREGCKWKYKVGDKTLLYKAVTIREINFRLSHMKDLHSLKFLLSVCRDEKNRGRSFSYKFFSSIKVKNLTK